MNKFYKIAEIVCVILVGLCGLALIVGGVVLGEVMPVILGIFGVLFCAVLPNLDKE